LARIADRIINQTLESIISPELFTRARRKNDEKKNAIKLHQKLEGLVYILN